MVESDPICGKCGYTLLGAPFKGTCPECGQEYDTALGIGLKKELSAVERGDRAMWWFGAITLGVMVCSSILCAGLGAAMNPTAMWWGIAGVVIFGLWFVNHLLGRPKH